MQIASGVFARVFLRVRRKTEPTGPEKIGITDLNNQTSYSLFYMKRDLLAEMVLPY